MKKITYVLSLLVASVIVSGCADDREVTRLIERGAVYCEGNVHKYDTFAADSGTPIEEGKVLPSDEAASQPSCCGNDFCVEDGDDSNSRSGSGGTGGTNSDDDETGGSGGTGGTTSTGGATSTGGMGGVEGLSLEDAFLLCVAGECPCTQGQTRCAGVCTPTQEDPLNCGACGVVCDSFECRDGKCVD